MLSEIDWIVDGKFSNDASSMIPVKNLTTTPPISSDTEAATLINLDVSTCFLV
jgi:hypothetical protein